MAMGQNPNRFVSEHPNPKCVVNSPNSPQNGIPNRFGPPHSDLPRTPTSAQPQAQSLKEAVSGKHKQVGAWTLFCRALHSQEEKQTFELLLFSYLFPLNVSMSFLFCVFFFCVSKNIYFPYVSKRGITCHQTYVVSIWSSPQSSLTR